MKKIGASLASLMLALTITSCNFDGTYRYKCQDSANWDTPECNPPICETSGTCSRDLIPKEVWDEYQKSKVKNG
jgi:hypothetical protein